MNFTPTVFGSVANDDLKIIIFVQSTHNVNDVLECLAIDPECIPHFGFGNRKWGRCYALTATRDSNQI